MPAAASPAVVGDNGTGKSTLVKLPAGRERWTSSHPLAVLDSDSLILGGMVAMGCLATYLSRCRESGEAAYIDPGGTRSAPTGDVDSGR